MTDRDAAWFHDSNLLKAPSKQLLPSYDRWDQNCNSRTDEPRGCFGDRQTVAIDCRDGDENTGGIVGWGLPGTAKISADKSSVV